MEAKKKCRKHEKRIKKIDLIFPSQRTVFIYLSVHINILESEKESIVSEQNNE